MKKATLKIAALFVAAAFLMLCVSCGAKKETPSEESKGESIAPTEESGETVSPAAEPSRAEESSVASGASKVPTAKAETSASTPSVAPPKSRGEQKSDAFYASYQQKTNLPWYLKLANKANLLEGDIDCDFTDVGSGRLFDSRAAQSLMDMVAACRSAGNSIWAQSTYRSVSYQQKLLDNRINAEMSYGYDKETATARALEWIAPPGGSEHNLGLAVDFNNVTDDFEYTGAYQWSQEHAAEYGFILRYPKDDVAITGYGYEPWHYRYIGKEHAEAMKALGITTLEEYVYLLENGNA